MRVVSSLILALVAMCCAGCPGDQQGPAAPKIVTTALEDGQVDAAYRASLVASGGQPPYAWSLDSGQPPAGLAVDSSGVLSGIPTNTSDTDFIVAVQDANANSGRARISIRIRPAAATITTTQQQIPAGVVGSAYSFTLSAIRGTLPYSWQVTAGALPGGLGLDASTGLIYGTPTAAGTASATITVTDADASSASVTFALQIFPASAPTITTAPQLPNGVIANPYSATLTAAGGTPPYRWQVTAGSLPTGLALDSNTGTISGITAQVGTATATIMVSDANSASASVTFSLRIFPAPPAITTSAQLPTGVAGAAYSVALAATGGTTPYRWQVMAGTLPAGVSLNSTTGVVSGTPTTAGTATPTISVTDANFATASRVFSLQINPAPLLITTASGLASGTVGSNYSAPLNATGGTTPYRWQVTSGALPAGLSLDAPTGVIFGTPTSAVSANVTITVTDANSVTSSSTFTLRVNPAPIVITSQTTLPDGTLGTAYATTLVATGGTTPYRWQVTAGALPAGTTLDSTTGVISGTPTTGGTTSATISVTDAASGSASAVFSLRVRGGPLNITTASQLPNAVILTPYDVTLSATDGTPPYQWQVTSGTLPAGLALNAATGSISGTPTRATLASVTISVTDANSASGSRAFTLRVLATPVAITTGSTLPDGRVAAGYNTTLAAVGGSPPYSWQVSSGALPAGLSLNAGSGVISGTPTTATNASLGITVTDADAASISASFTLRVLAGTQLSITTALQLPGGSVGSPYSVTLAASGGTTPYTWQVTGGALPPGLSLNTNTGVISGTPSAAASSTPTITVTDANSATTSASFSLQVQATPLGITSATLPDGVTGTAYNATLTASGGTAPYHWQLSGGALPAGLTLNTSNGVISGTPTTAATSNATFTVIDSLSVSSSATLSLTIKAAGTGWQLVWSDEFDGTTLSSAKWLNPTNDNSCNGYSQQTVAADDSYLDGNGHLVIRAQSRASGGCGPMHLTAGQISTSGRFAQAYGKFEFRAQMPAGGGGIWPALWLYPIGVSWPPEIDVLEAISDMSTAYMTYHWSSSNQQSLATYSNPSLASGYHTYTVEWEPGNISWFIDGVMARSSFSGTDVASTPMGILIDIYLGGWAGAVTASFPQYMLVDYVRVYKKN